MTVDCLQVLPDFDTKPYTHLLPSLDKALITTNDLITLDAADVAKRAQVPVADLKKLVAAILVALHQDLGFGEGEHGNTAFLSTPASTTAQPHNWVCISTLDEKLDEALGGGIPPGCLTEVTGESGAGKTQLLFTLLLAAQLPAPQGLGKSAIYISTEAPLATSRLTQLLSAHPSLSSVPPQEKPSLSKILSIQLHDLETQEHILRYQLPVAIQKHNVGLVILDSVAANFRAEFQKGGFHTGPIAMAKRGGQLVQLGALLRNLARTEGIAIVVANQVADRFAKPSLVLTPSHQLSRATSQNSQTRDQGTPERPPTHLADTVETAPTSSDAMALDHQQRWTTGWGDDPFESPHNMKTPSLGLVWTNQISCRIALIKRPVYSNSAPSITADGEFQYNEEQHHIAKWRRWFKIVFSPWTAPSPDRGVEYEILKSGIRHVSEENS